ncbi:hypothetical protein, partial [Streptomyces sp. NPDC041003]|uniref:hypothetical protein n=1 Tax=Streptomyces sp. NPDC041003 TaxID=3155730 RepID=UPI0033D34445
MTGPEPVPVDGVPVPDHGAWLRRGISRNGGPLVEDREVVWLQAGSYYADSRGFAGTTSFDGSQVHFHHLTGEPGDCVQVIASRASSMDTADGVPRNSLAILIPSRT